MKIETFVFVLLLLIVIFAYKSGYIQKQEILIEGEPDTCGNGVIDIGESYLNCDNDMPLTIITKLGCITAGKDSCLYFKQALDYMFFCVLLFIIGLVSLRKVLDG